MRTWSKTGAAALIAALTMITTPDDARAQATSGTSTAAPGATSTAGASTASTPKPKPAAAQPTAPASGTAKPTTTGSAKPATGTTGAAKPPATGAAAGSAAAAGPSKADLATAKKAYQAGETKFKAGDYAGALTEFQTADGIKSTPQSQRYIGLCHDKLGHLAEASASYDRFLADVPPKLQKEGDEIKKRNDEIKAMPGKVHAESNPAGATVTADGKPASGPTPTDIELPPGKHTLHFTMEGRVAQDKDVDVAFASSQNVSAELEAVPPPPPPPVAPVAATPPPPPPPPPAPPPEPRSKVPAYVTGGLAVVSAGIGTVFGIMALGDKSDFDKNPTASKADDGENHALIADMAFGVAITLGVTSAVLLLTNDEPATTAAPTAKATKPAPKTRARIVPTPFVTHNGGGAGALVRF